jgi:hypothetical protein
LSCWRAIAAHGGGKSERARCTHAVEINAESLPAESLPWPQSGSTRTVSSLFLTMSGEVFAALTPKHAGASGDFYVAHAAVTALHATHARHNF